MLTSYSAHLSVLALATTLLLLAAPSARGSTCIVHEPVSEELRLQRVEVQQPDGTWVELLNTDPFWDQARITYGSFTALVYKESTLPVYTVLTKLDGETIVFEGRCNE